MFKFLKDDYREAGLSPLLEAMAFLIFHDDDAIDRYMDLTIVYFYDSWEDPEKVDFYFTQLIQVTDMVKRNITSKFIKKGELLLLDFRMERV